MTRARVAGFAVSLDGFGAGAEQSLDQLLGLRGGEMFQWLFPTRAFRQMQGQEDGETGPDNDFAERAIAGFGALDLASLGFRTVEHVATNRATHVVLAKDGR